MSVLINGMEIPEHCGECKLKAEYDDETFCPFFADNVEYWIAAGRRHEDCPLGYIPPHGDLIDRDALLINVDPAIHEDYVDSSGYCFDCEYGYTREQIESVPTVIEADEGE